MRTIALPAIKETREDYEAIERVIIDWFRTEIYQPLLREITPPETLHNAADDVSSAIRAGRISYRDGRFEGRFNAAVSAQLQKWGAQWRDGFFYLEQERLPYSVIHSIMYSAARFDQMLERLNRALSRIVPAQIADMIDLTKAFDTTLLRADKKISGQLKKISVLPELDRADADRFHRQYTDNMKKSIVGWTEGEIEKLRDRVQAHTFKGFRHENLVKKIEESYELSKTKARFLARQETNLIMAKFKEVRYQSAGIAEYKWKCAAGSTSHPVRPMHKALENKIFRFDDPPITSPDGRRNNPGEDYNCRCTALPIVRF